MQQQESSFPRMRRGGRGPRISPGPIAFDFRHADSFFRQGALVVLCIMPIDFGVDPVWCVSAAQAFHFFFRPVPEGPSVDGETKALSQYA